MWLHVVAVKAEHGTIREMRAREPLKPPWPNGKGKSARQQGPTSRWGAGYRATSAAFTRAFGVKGSSLALTSRTTTSAATSLLASRDDHLRENREDYLRLMYILVCPNVRPRMRRQARSACALDPRPGGASIFDALRCRWRLRPHQACTKTDVFRARGLGFQNRSFRCAGLNHPVPMCFCEAKVGQSAILMVQYLL
jgi:hypothetical protein